MSALLEPEDNREPLPPRKPPVVKRPLEEKTLNELLDERNRLKSMGEPVGDIDEELKLRY